MFRNISPDSVRSGRTCPANLGVQSCLVRKLICPVRLSPTLISLINVEPTLTNFEKFHPPQKKIPPPRLLISLLKCLILLQNLMTIFLTIILSYKTLLSARLASASASISPFVRLIFDPKPQFHYILNNCVILKI